MLATSTYTNNQIIYGHTYAILSTYSIFILPLLHKSKCFRLIISTFNRQMITMAFTFFGMNEQKAVNVYTLCCAQKKSCLTNERAFVQVIRWVVPMEGKKWKSEKVATESSSSSFGLWISLEISHRNMNEIIHRNSNLKSPFFTFSRIVPMIKQWGMEAKRKTRYFSKNRTHVQFLTKPYN